MAEGVCGYAIPRADRVVPYLLLTVAQSSGVGTIVIAFTIRDICAARVFTWRNVSSMSAPTDRLVLQPIDCTEDSLRTTTVTATAAQRIIASEITARPNGGCQSGFRIIDWMAPWSPTM